MAFLTKIKLGSVNNLSDARYAAAAGIDYIGFCFDPTQAQYIVPIKAKEIIDWIAGTVVVGEFGNQSIQEISDISELLNIDVIEVENGCYPDELKTLNQAIIKKVDIEQYNEASLRNELQAYASVADAFHFYVGSHNPDFDTTHALKLANDYRIIWGLDTHTGDIKNWVQSQHPFGINIISGEEERPGIKDFDQIADILEQLTIEEI
jgi:phosphoribosylanthranilate isomerase